MSASPRPLPDVTTPRSSVRRAAASPCFNAGTSPESTLTDETNLGTTVLPACTEAITAAITIGEARIRP